MRCRLRSRTCALLRPKLKGSHRNLKHPKGQSITISGRMGSDAKRYQIRDTEKAIKESQR
jgi:predicted RNA binding protein YcfA (HicA-like mRNA interferase family)